MAINRAGFTLLEVMVALLIMAVLTMLTAQALKSAVDNKVFVAREVSKDSQLADSLRIMRGDIASAFHYQNLFCKMDGDLATGGTSSGSAPAAAAAAPGQPGNLANFGQPAAGLPSASGTPAPCPTEVTGFVGDEKSLYFTSLSNVRTLRDSQEGDQAKVGYYLKSCKSRVTKQPAQCLYRSISPILDQDIDKPGKETLLLENVDEFKLRYLGPQHEDYVSEWKTGKFGTDDIAKTNFPYAVEITLTIYDKGDRKDKKATEVVLAPLYFENNPPKAGATPSPGNGNPSTVGNGGKAAAAVKH